MPFCRMTFNDTDQGPATATTGFLAAERQSRYVYLLHIDVDALSLLSDYEDAQFPQRTPSHSPHQHR